MARLVKCQYCGEKESSDLMRKGVSKKGYIHTKCIPAYEQQQEEKRIEKEQWNELYEYLKELFDIVQVPPRNIKRLHEIKQNNNITYKLILDAFKIAEDKIKWFRHEVRDGGNNADDINAYITLMLNSGLNEAVKQEKEKGKKEKIQKRQFEQTTVRDMSYEIKVNKNKKDELDISEWL